MRSVKCLIVCLASLVGIAHGSNGWDSRNFNTLVTFGDSYSDEGRLGYFINNNGSAPPVGWKQPVGLNTASGGRSWPRYASVYSNASLYNYAVSGAVCSNQISPRWFSAINAPFPDIAGYELPAFIAESKYTSANGTKFFTGTEDDTVYAVWIGTNDLGNNAFLTDFQLPGKTLKDYIDCVYSTVDTLYANGGRYFVLLNLAPLQLLPQYATPENGGLEATKFFPEKRNISTNLTEISWKIYENVVTVNEVLTYRTAFEANIGGRWDGAKIAVYNVNGLITDIWKNPANYLNGTAPLNVTGNVYTCDTAGNNCKSASNPDSYLWYDELHPSEQTSRVIAKEFVGVLDGKSKWAKYWG